MKIIVGLGNPGEKYVKTRHNIGFMVVDELAKKLSSSKFKFTKENKFNAEILKCQYQNEEILLVKPQTMMNASGLALAKIQRFYKIKELNDLWVIHDDLDLSIGKIKIVKGHGSAGHHGIDSIINELKTDDFVRFRIGIGFSGRAEDYVLKEFQGKEAVEANRMIKKVVDIVEYGLKTNLVKCMNRYNAK